MVNAATIRGLAARLERADALVADGAVYPVAGCDDDAVVRNGDGTQMYLVRVTAGRETCSCPDLRQRQQGADLPCKHLLAAQLALESDPPPLVSAVDSAKVETARRLGIMAPGKAAA